MSLNRKCYVGLNRTAVASILGPRLTDRLEVVFQCEEHEIEELQWPRIMETMEGGRVAPVKAVCLLVSGHILWRDLGFLRGYSFVKSRQFHIVKRLTG